MKVCDGDLRVELDGQLGHRLTDIPVVVHHLIDREAQVE
jgi:hypothetical protein